jgi:hypothetical protein
MQIAPIRNQPIQDKPWEGDCEIKPWDYQITAVVPVMDTYDSLSLCIDLLRLQTIKPYIIVIDTGSTKENFEKIESLRSKDIEVHSLRLNGVEHPSDFVAMAMDLGQSLCRTKFLFATHADVFLMKRNFLEYLINICGDHLEDSSKFPVVGYEISPRQHTDWQGMISHTASIYYLKTLDKIGFGWSMRRLASLYNLPNYKPNPMRPNWPDTEILGNVILRQHDIPVKIIGKENNFQRNRDDNIDHCRSITSGLLYSPEYYKKAYSWYEEAKNQALDRIKSWEKEIDEQRIS